MAPLCDLTESGLEEHMEEYSNWSLKLMSQVYTTHMQTCSLVTTLFKQVKICLLTEV